MSMSSSTLTQAPADRTAGWLTRIADYVELTKPRILSMVLVTIALSSVIATWGQPDLARLAHTLIGTTLVAGSASLFNQWLERAADARMHRTANRPLPSGRLGRWEVFAIGAASVLIGLSYLLNLTTTAAAFWAAATWLLYVGVYTPLKKRTWLNTMVGAVPGAIPVLIGWAGVGVELDTRGICLFMLVFFWQFPHFMAIAWLYRQQYRVANMQMLTVVDPSGRRAGGQAVVAATSVLMVSLVPAALAVSASPLYLFATTALGLGQLQCALQFNHHRSDVTARRLLRASIIYLPLQLLLIMMLNLAVI
jgi:protoheme IX farnesyltransferase